MITVVSVQYFLLLKISLPKPWDHLFSFNMECQKNPEYNPVFMGKKLLFFFFSRYIYYLEIKKEQEKALIYSKMERSQLHELFYLSTIRLRRRTFPAIYPQTVFMPHYQLITTLTLPKTTTVQTSLTIIFCLS